MNLVKLQDELKMLPLPLLTAKSQGQDPNVPPWLAASVLNERVAAEKKAGLEKGAAQGPQPSVVEKLQAGLMSLEAQKMQQGQQQMMQQAAQAPQAVPEQAPQPEEQPEEQAMASGGIARLPVDPRMFNYKSGGVIGFAVGDLVESSGSDLDAVKERAAQAIAKLRSYGLNQQRQDPQGYQQAQQEVAEAQQAVREAITRYQSNVQEAGLNKPYFATAKPVMASPQKVEQQKESQGIGSIFVPGSQSGLRPEAAQPSAPSPEARPAPRPAPQAASTAISTGASQSTMNAPADQQSEIERMEMEALRKQQAPKTIADLKAERDAATPELLRQPAGLEQLARLKAQQEAYDKSKEDRGLERLMQVLSARSRGGLGGFGTGYVNAVTGERAADAAQAAYQDKVMTAVEAARRGEATTEQKELLDALKNSRTIEGENERNRIKSLVDATSAQKLSEYHKANIASQERLAAMDRQLRAQLHSTPPAQRQTIEENAIQDLIKQEGLSYADAYARVKQISSGYKGEMTLDQATKRVDDLLKDASGRMYIREIQAKAREAGQPVPDIMSIRQALIDREMGGSARPTPSKSKLISEADRIVSGGK